MQQLLTTRFLALRVAKTLGMCVALSACSGGFEESQEGALVTQDLHGECSTTTQCKAMYGDAALDCSNSGGGVCLCGPAKAWCSSLEEPGDSDCDGDAECSAAQYCNFNQGQVCTPDRPAGTHCTRNAQCQSGQCVVSVCEASGGGSGGGLGPSDPGNPAQYTGQTHWKASTGTLTFLTNGTLPNTHRGWTVPSQVKRLVIAKNVQVSGRFNVNHTATVVGEDRKTSRIFGTNQTGYNANNDGCGFCKSAVLGTGNITVTVQNLTTQNPFGFHLTGKEGAKFVVDSVDALDTRGGSGNNSDGIAAAAGTVVRNSYFETGDDVIKVYADILVENTTIKMVQNTVPIQFGWGSYGSGAHGVFKNLTVTGTGGRNPDNNAFISARAGTYDKTVEIHGLYLENPNAVVMTARESRGNAQITIDDAFISVKNFRGASWSMNADFEVCGTEYRNGQGAPNRFDCRE